MFEPLKDDLLEIFGRGVDEPLPEQGFNELALRVFRYQVQACEPYGALVRARGLDPEAVDDWREIPPVPTGAFRELTLVSGDPEEVEAVFLTSGTTRGRKSRGEHHVLSLELYEASLLPNFRHHLLPDGATPSLVSLIPSPGDMDESSLSHMVGVVSRELGDGEWNPRDYFVNGRGDLRAEGLAAALSRAQEAEEPILMVGTAFAFVHWLEAMAARSWRFPLPEGSRVMETGGFKGRSRAVSQDELYGMIEDRHGVPPHRIVNEYGMTELLSQHYDHVIGTQEPESRLHTPPPWVRTRVLDPVSLEPLPDGERGLLCHLDLANLGSVCHVLTEDMGVAEGDGFRVLGRAEGAEPRGCSRAMDELLSAAENG